MNAVEILAALKKFGKPQTAAIYKRHGAGDNVFGTLTSEIDKLQKKIKVDHTLAMELWRTGNAEARILALQVSDPQRLTRADADRLLRDGQTH
jgi:3-methyladenine DNA glycosylase AlkD